MILHSIAEQVFIRIYIYKLKKMQYQIIINSYTLDQKKKMFYYPTSLTNFNSPSKPKQLQTFVLIGPPSLSFSSSYDFLENSQKSCAPTQQAFAPLNIELHQSSQSKMQDEYKDSESDYMNIQKISISDTLKQDRQRKRKNKQEKNRQIEEKHKDDGRGGNCIASNISKTLNRIIQSTLKKQVFYNFEKYLKAYKIKSQKENTIILLLLLYIHAKQKKISLQTLEKIFENFFKSLHDSQANCDKKMKLEQSRRNFHLKNRKMYSKFIEINQNLYRGIIHSLSTQAKSSTFTLQYLQNIISDTYDRKQRQIQKAMNKIKSIILRHQELKSLFDYHQNDIKKALFQSIDYAFRRNLPKRCKQIKLKIQQIFNEFESKQQLEQEQNKYLVCYIALKLIDDKFQQIWKEFVTNLKMKNEFNKSEKQLQEFEKLLTEVIPYRFANIPEQKKNTIIAQDQNICKIEQQTGGFGNTISNIASTFHQLKNSLNY